MTKPIPAVIRVAETEEEREAIYKLRYKIYVEEMHIFGAVADHDRKMLKGENDDTARLLYASVDGEMVGSLRLNLGKDGPFSDELERTYNLESFRSAVRDDHMLVLTRFMVTKKYRGSILGFQMIGEVAKITIQEGIEVAVCDCQPHLINYYQRIGFLSYPCNVYNDPEFGIMVPLVYIVGNIPYLKQIRSPLLSIFAEYTSNKAVVNKLEELIRPEAVKDAVADYEENRNGLADFLAGGDISLLSGLTDADIKTLIKNGHVIECAPGDRVIRKGQPVSTMYIVTSGHLEVRINHGKTVHLSPGEVVGELALLLTTRRTADVIAGRDGACLLSLNERQLKKSFRGSSKMAASLLMNLSKVVARRLAETITDDSEEGLPEAEIPLV